MFKSPSLLFLTLCVVLQLLVLPTLWAQRTAKKQPPTPATENQRVRIPPEIQKLFSEGEQLKVTGKPTEAARKFKAAANMAKDVKDPGFNLPHVEAAALLKQANIYYSEAIRDNDRAKLASTLKLYENIQVDAAPQQRTEATMNRAALHMKLGDPQKAADLLLDREQFDWSTIDQSQQFRLNYNVGRALEEGPKPARAFEYYEKSLLLNPRFNLAASKISDLALADKSLSAESLDKHIALLISTQHPEEVTRLGWGLFQREGVGNRQGAMRGLAILLTGWSKSFENSATFLKSERERLSQLRTSFIGPRFASDITRLVHGELSVAVESLQSGQHPQLPGVTEVISDADTEQGRLKVAMAAFTFAIADGMATRSSLATDPSAAGALAQMALARNIVAFGLDPSNADGSRSLIWSLVRVEESAQMEGIDKLRDRVVLQLMNEKESLRNKGNKTATDWQSLLKIHMLLAQLFQSKKIWRASDEYRSATFHWEEARRDEAALRELLPENRRQWTPAIHENLAICYAKSARKPAAVAEWLFACDYYLRNDDLAGATRCLQSVRTSEVDLSPQQQERVTILDKQIQSLDELIKNAPK